MGKLSLKIFVYIYVFITIIIDAINPFLTGFISYKIVNPYNFFSVVMFIIVWFIISFIVLIIAKYLYKQIRLKFKKFDDLLFKIENYIENQKQNN